MSDTVDQAELATTPDVVAVLVENHREFLDFLERRVGSRAAAEDILQEAFARGLNALDALRDGESAVAWFYRVLRNAVVDHYRRRGAQDRSLDAFARHMVTESAAPAELQRRICSCVSSLARTLKPEYAAILQRVEVDGLPVKDYAAEAGISAGNAAVRIFRAREALRRRVARSCGTCAEHGCLDCTCSSSGGHCAG